MTLPPDQQAVLTYRNALVTKGLVARNVEGRYVSLAKLNREKAA